MFFQRNLAPAQPAVGDCPPLKESPGRVPAAGDFFLLLLIKINNFLMKIVIFLLNIIFFDTYLMICDLDFPFILFNIYDHVGKNPVHDNPLVICDDYLYFCSFLQSEFH